MLGLQIIKSNTVNHLREWTWPPNDLFPRGHPLFWIQSDWDGLRAVWLHKQTFSSLHTPNASLAVLGGETPPFLSITSAKRREVGPFCSIVGCKWIPLQTPWTDTKIGRRPTGNEEVECVRSRKTPQDMEKWIPLRMYWKPCHYLFGDPIFDLPGELFGIQVVSPPGLVASEGR